MNISVCICAYNAADRIQPVLDALRIQHGVSSSAWEVILVDNNSSDDTSLVASIVFKRFDCPTKIVNERQQGLAYARKTAYENATGEVIAYIDDDNVVAPDWVFQCVRFFEDHPNAGVVGGKVLARCDAPVPPYWTNIKWMLAVRDDMGELDRCLAPTRPGAEIEIPCGAGMVVNRKALRDVYSKYSLSLSGRLGRSLSSGEDIEMGLRIVGLGWESWYCSALVLWHLIPKFRLSEEYLCRLRYGIVRSCTVTDSIGKYGMYPPPLKESFRHLWWSVCTFFRNWKVYSKRDFNSVMLQSVVRGRLHGSLHEVRDAISKRGRTLFR